MTELVTITDQKAVTTSLIIAEAFEKQHKNVLRDIAKLECSKEFTELNFEPSAYMDPTGRMLPMYHITRDGFVFLAMGFTGKRAAEFKERFIAAFNEMERALLEGTGDRRRVDVNYSNFRSMTNPHGLDIQYRFDLTKIALRPTREGVQILERLTGVDMQDIVAMVEPATKTRGREVVSTSVDPVLVADCLEEMIRRGYDVPGLVFGQDEHGRPFVQGDTTTINDAIAAMAHENGRPYRATTFQLAALFSGPRMAALGWTKELASNVRGNRRYRYVRFDQAEN